LLVSAKLAAVHLLSVGACGHSLVRFDSQLSSLLVPKPDF
jgi:hypothetical protein